MHYWWRYLRGLPVIALEFSVWSSYLSMNSRAGNSLSFQFVSVSPVHLFKEKVSALHLNNVVKKETLIVFSLCNQAIERPSFHLPHFHVLNARKKNVTADNHRQWRVISSSLSPGCFPTAYFPAFFLILLNDSFNKITVPSYPRGDYFAVQDVHVMRVSLFNLSYYF